MNSQKKLLLESLKEEGFSKEILKAFEKIKRENFIPENLRKYAYKNIALPIGQNQTISQPYTIAVMLSLLTINSNKKQKILEIGSGCGYVLALLSELIETKGKVFGIEIIKELYEKSKNNLKEFKNVRIYNKNGFYGLEERAPFDTIIISAAINKIPENLISQLKDNGMIVAPIKNKYEQSLISYKKSNNKLKVIKEIPGFVFVPFVKN